MSIDTNFTIITTIKIRDEEYELPDKLRIEDRLRSLVKELIKRIKEKLENSTDFYFKYAYTHADILNEIVKPEDSDAGGHHINGILYVGRVGFNGGAMGSDEDVMATIFHEFMHYIAFKNNKFPYRYENKEEGEIWYKNVILRACLQTEDVFYQNSYESFIADGYRKEPEEAAKYYDYPFGYKELSIEQRLMFEKYIKEQGLKPSITEELYRYTPSNYPLDEINAHTKTLEANQMGVFSMSQAKLVFYDNEIKRYKNVYKICIEIEEQYGYTPEGYEK